MIPTALMGTAFLLLFGISKGPRHFKSTHVREAAIKSILAGWKFIWHNPVMLSVMALDMFAVLFGGAVAMLPAYADQVLHVGSEGVRCFARRPGYGCYCYRAYLGSASAQTYSRHRIAVRRHRVWPVHDRFSV